MAVLHFTLLSSKFPSNIYSILFVQNSIHELEEGSEAVSPPTLRIYITILFLNFYFVCSGIVTVNYCLSHNDQLDQQCTLALVFYNECNSDTLRVPLSCNKICL